MLNIINRRITKCTLNDQIPTDNKKYLYPQPSTYNSQIRNRKNIQTLEMIREHKEHSQCSQSFNGVIF